MIFESTKSIRKYLSANKIYDLKRRDQLITLVRLVAEIPWGEGRTVCEVLETKKRGTCTGKHLVLQACFNELEIKYQPVVCTFRWQDQEINYPENLKAILEEGE